MPKFIPMTAVLILAGVTAAIAQGNTGASTGAPVIVQPGPAYAPELNAAGAPALRQRQPRRGGVPDESERISNIDPEDAAVDRKIRSICRGC
jgi:hypothetical protein